MALNREELNLSEYYTQNAGNFIFYHLNTSKVLQLSLSNQSWNFKKEFVFIEIKCKKSGLANFILQR